MECQQVLISARNRLFLVPFQNCNVSCGQMFCIFRDMIVVMQIKKRTTW